MTSGASWCNLLLGAGLTSVRDHVPQDLAQSIVSVSKVRIATNSIGYVVQNLSTTTVIFLFYPVGIYLAAACCFASCFFCLHLGEWSSMLSETTSQHPLLYVVDLSTQPS